MKKASIGLLIFGIFCLIVGLVMSAFGVYIWGGVLDGWICLWGIVSILCGAVLTSCNDFFEKHCSLKSLGLAFGISMFTGVGLNCFLRLVGILLLIDPIRAPIFVSTSLIFGFISFIAVIVLFILYVIYRRKNPSLKGVIADVSVGIVYIVPFIGMYSLIYSACAGLFHLIFPNL